MANIIIPPTTDSTTTTRLYYQPQQDSILQRQHQQRNDEFRTFHLSKFRWSVTELSSSSSSSSLLRDDVDDDDSCIEVDVTKRNDDDQHHSHKLIALEWIQKFQHLLTLSFDPISSKNTNIRQKEIQNSIRQIFVHTKKDNDERSSEHIAAITTTPFWRDMMAFTWNIITLEGDLQISNFLCTASAVDTTIVLCQPSTKDSWMIDETKDITLTTLAGSMIQRIDFWCIFHTNIGVGRAHVRLVQSPRQFKENYSDQHHPNDDDDDDDWKAYTLLTTLQSLHNRPWNVAPYHRPITGTITTVTNSIQQQEQQEKERGKAIPNRVYWHDQKELYQQEQQRHPYVVIIGGGQGGLSLAARLQYLQIPYVVYEMGSTVGTSWRQHRYPSLYLHDPVYYNHMPYIEFPKTWPIFCPRNKIANFMECYVQLLDLNVVCHSKVVRAEQNQDTNMWLIDIEQRMPSSSNNDDGSDIVISKSTIQCRHIVFATGNSSHPRRPNLKQSHLFRGIQIHSSQYEGGKVYRNKSIRHVIVVGSNNSAMDICQDIWEQLSQTNGGTVETITMIQRTPGMVVSTQSVLQYGLGPLYSEEATLHHEEADIVATTVPYKIALSSKWKHVTQLMEQNDAIMLNELQKAGYRLDNGPNGTGIFAKSATEGGGFYIDHGCAELIIRNDITIRFATVMELQSDSIVIQHIDDPTCVETLPADMIIYATGFDTMDRYVQEICGTDVSNRVGRTWGLGLGHNSKKDPSPYEGELRNMWKPTTVNGLWFQGGNLAQNRHYSRYLALQLAARYIGINPIVYGIPKPMPLKA